MLPTAPPSYGRDLASTGVAARVSNAVNARFIGTSLAGDLIAVPLLGPMAIKTPLRAGRRETVAERCRRQKRERGHTVERGIESAHS